MAILKFQTLASMGVYSLENETMQSLNHESMVYPPVTEKLALAISKLLPIKFYATDTFSTISNVKDLTEKLKLDEEIYYLCIVSKFSGSVDVHSLIFMDMSSTDELLCYLTGRHVKILNRFEKSALQELANIIIGTVVSEMSRRLNIQISYTIPDIVIGLPSHLMDFFTKFIGSKKLYISVFKVTSGELGVELLISLMAPLEDGDFFA